MEPLELERRIKLARIERFSKLSLDNNELTRLSVNIGNITSLRELSLHNNKLSQLPEKIGNLSQLQKLCVGLNQLNTLPGTIGNLSRLRVLNLSENQLNTLPDTLGNLSRLRVLYLSSNQLNNLPESICTLSNLAILALSNNKFDSLPENICKLSNLEYLYLSGNNLTVLPTAIYNLSNLTLIYLSDNPFTDLSIVKNIPNIESLYFFNVDLPRRYWTKLSDWKSEWLLDEDNTEVRSVLIEHLGYQKVCEELKGIEIDSWREYTLLKIEDIQMVYDEDGDPDYIQPMVLLKMTCPSTQHIHILRVPPEMTSAEDATTWVNHGIHPDKFAVQT